MNARPVRSWGELTSRGRPPSCCERRSPHPRHQRWQVEPFFKWIKQHLRIKHFFGTSPNAVKTQILIGAAVYVLTAIVKKQMRLDHSLYTILQVLSTSLFDKTPIPLVFQHYDERTNFDEDRKQPVLFDI
jgi:hypothetical protein